MHKKIKDFDIQTFPVCRVLTDGYSPLTRFIPNHQTGPGIFFNETMLSITASNERMKNT